MKKNREKVILQMMYQHEFVTSSMMAEELQLTTRTIHTLIKDMNQEHSIYGAKILSKKSQGYYLQMEDKEKLLSFLENQDETEEYIPDSPNERRSFISLYLLNQSDYIKLDDLCETLFVSKGTINNDIKNVKEWISDFHLTLHAKPNYGLKIIGDEIDRRICIAECRKNKNSYVVAKIVKQAYIEEQVEEILRSVLSNENYMVSAILLKNLVIHISVALHRIMEQQTIRFDEQVMKEFEGISNLSLAKKITEKLNVRLKMKIPEQEVQYIALQLSSKQILDDYVKNENLIVDQMTMDIVNTMIYYVKDAFGIDLENDIDLKMRLCQHLIPLKLRLDYGMIADNPLLISIKQEYPLAYAMASLASGVLYEQYLRRLSEDEIGYIAVSFALSLEKQKENKKKNVLLVCGSGLGSAKLMELKVKEDFEGYIDHITTCDVNELSSIDFSSIDYVFTTIKLEQFIPVPIVEMPLFPNKKEVNVIKHQMEASDHDIDISKYFHEDLFFNHCKKESKEEILQFMCEQIEQQKLCDPGLFESVLEREKLGKTVFGNHVAMPHPTRAISETTLISVCVLDKPVQWDDEEVKIIFLISISKKKNKNLSDLYKGITSLFFNKTYIQELYDKQSFQTLKRIIKSIEQNKGGA